MTETLLIQISRDEIKAMIIEAVREAMSGKSDEKATSSSSPTEYVYGIGGLARLLNCSNPTAQRIKDSGKIPFTQVGRKLIFDVNKVLTALNRK